ncbi:MAG TPA: hypothetical protein VF064_02065 [Pyrinomonadaceae bacterium]
MAKSRQATPVTLTEWQRERLEHLWFVFGNHGPKTTPGNHQFIQGLLEHGIDLRPLQTKRTARRDVPTGECVAAVEQVLSSKEGGEEGAARSGRLRLVPSPDPGRRTQAPDPELKRMLDEMRERLTATRGRGGIGAGGGDAA